MPRSLRTYKNSTRGYVSTHKPYRNRRWIKTTQYIKNRIHLIAFKDLNIIAPILKALEKEGYTQPTPIQEQSIPILLEHKDLLGCAQTGTGKTASFAIPILQHLFTAKQINRKKRKIKALVVTPTRELAIQIGDSFSTYGQFTGLYNTVIFGGVKQKAQTDALSRGVDILVATPGRLLDLIGQGLITLKDVEYFVLDEADHMLDMGFIHDIRKIIKLLPEKRQSLFFSATMPQAIISLSGKILGNPEKVTIAPLQTTAEKVDQGVYFVAKKNKVKLLIHILKENDYASVLVFSRTKHGANKIVKLLNKAEITAEAIHGNKSQPTRQRALNNFKRGDIRVLVATDIAARGIDVDDLELVVNFDLSDVSETYVHRIGRTGRAKKSGIALSFCDIEEKGNLRDIQKLIGQEIPVIQNHPFPDDGIRAPKEPQSVRPQRKPRSSASNSQGSNEKRSKRTSPNENKDGSSRRFGRSPSKRRTS